MTTTEGLRQFCERAVGPCTLQPQQRSDRGHQSSRIARVIDAEGRHYVAKVHTCSDKHRREVHAYTHWTPALGHHAPRLLAADPGLPAVLLTAVPGEPADRAEHRSGVQALAIWRQAGMLLRRLHDAEPAKPMADFADRLNARLDGWLTAAHGLLTAAEQQTIRGHLAALGQLPPPVGVPCHLDYQPHNWLWDQAGILSIVDFEHARIDAAPRDLVRLAFRHWTCRPDLREAFLDGYGRQLTTVEQQLLVHCAAVDVVTCLVRARDTANPTLARHGRATLRQLPALP